MSGARFRQYFRPLMAVGAYAHRALLHSRGRELRLLERRVAAARLGVGWSRQAVLDFRYEDLR
jgi:hypothetical protein